MDEQTFLKRYKNLPEDVKQAYGSVEVTEQLQNIGKKHQLHIDQVGALVDEVGWVMIGVTHPSNFVKKVAERLAIDKEQARKIAAEVNEQVFRPIRESLKRIHSIGDVVDEETRDKEQKTREEKPQRPVQKPTTQPTTPKKEGEVPENLPSETENQPAPEMEEEYPPVPEEEGVESKEEILKGIEDAPIKDVDVSNGAAPLEGGEQQEKTWHKQKTPTAGTISSTSTPTSNEDKEQREREQALAEQPKDIVKEQLSGPTRAPHEETERDLDEEQQKSITGQHEGQDPYRELIE